MSGHSLKLHFCMFEKSQGKHISWDCYETNIKLQNINRYQLVSTLAFCFTSFEAQGQTFDNLIIDL